MVIIMIMIIKLIMKIMIMLIIVIDTSVPNREGFLVLVLEFLLRWLLFDDRPALGCSWLGPSWCWLGCRLGCRLPWGSWCHVIIIIFISGGNNNVLMIRATINLHNGITTLLQRTRDLFLFHFFFLIKWWRIFLNKMKCWMTLITS